jgi:hypothetical protein
MVFFVHNRPLPGQAQGPESMSFLYQYGDVLPPVAEGNCWLVSVVGVAAALRFEQHALDDAGVDIARFQVFDGGDGVAAFLDRNSVVHDIAPEHVLALVRRFGDRKLAGGAQTVLIHRDSLPWVKKRTRCTREVSDKEYPSINVKVNVSFPSKAGIFFRAMGRPAKRPRHGQASGPAR